MEAFDVDITAVLSLFWFAFTSDPALYLCQSNDDCTMCFSSINIRSGRPRLLRENASPILAERALNRNAFAFAYVLGQNFAVLDATRLLKASEMDYLPPYRAGEFV